jgi:N-glycosylase/DNA lyase
MVDNLCKKYGTILCNVDGNDFYRFPSIQELATKATENELREMGFGYRARYIVTAAQQILKKETEMKTLKNNGKEIENGLSWLLHLRNIPHIDAQKELVSLMGIGKKVADCICLFSLDKLNVIPVDTHVWKIAQSYIPSLKSKKLNDQIYKEIGDFFKNKWGEYCGWAHTVLFAAELVFLNKEEKEPKAKKPRTNNSNKEVKLCEENF